MHNKNINLTTLISSYIGTGIISYFTALTDKVSTVSNLIYSSIANGLSMLATIPGSTYQMVAKGFSALAGTIKIVSNLIYSSIANGMSMLAAIPGSTYQMVAKGFSTLAGTIKIVSNSIYNWIAEGFNTVAETIKTVSGSAYNVTKASIAKGQGKLYASYKKYTQKYHTAAFIILMSSFAEYLLPFIYAFWGLCAISNVAKGLLRLPVWLAPLVPTPEMIGGFTSLFLISCLVFVLGIGGMMVLNSVMTYNFIFMLIRLPITILKNVIGWLNYTFMVIKFPDQFRVSKVGSYSQGTFFAGYHSASNLQINLSAYLVLLCISLCVLIYIKFKRGSETWVGFGINLLSWTGDFYSSMYRLIGKFVQYVIRCFGLGSCLEKQFYTNQFVSFCRKANIFGDYVQAWYSQSGQLVYSKCDNSFNYVSSLEKTWLQPGINLGNDIANETVDTCRSAYESVSSVCGAAVSKMEDFSSNAEVFIKQKEFKGVF